MCLQGVGGDTPLLPQLGSSLLQPRPGMTGPYVSHTDFSEGGWEGAGLRAPRRGHWGMPMTQHWARGHFGLTSPHPPIQVPGFVDGCWSEITASSPSICYFPKAVLPKVPAERPGLLWQQSAPMPPPPPRARQQLPLPERKAGLLGSRQEPELTSRAEGTPWKRGGAVSSTWHAASQATHNWPLDLDSSLSLSCPPSRGTHLSAPQALTTFSRLRSCSLRLQGLLEMAFQFVCWVKGEN